jgi:type I restriction-modification system DNA methylase subunit
MAQMTATPEAKTVLDCCCGSGRLLLAAADANPQAELVGWDIDERCVQITAINLALRNRYAWVIHGNSLSEEQWLIYRTGFNSKGVIAEVPPPKRPEPVARILKEIREVRSTGQQLSLF